jgi:hypothetical protein
MDNRLIPLIRGLALVYLLFVGVMWLASLRADVKKLGIKAVFRRSLVRTGLEALETNAPGMRKWIYFAGILISVLILKLTKF